jgi:hypothetical protein
MRGAAGVNRLYEAMEALTGELAAAARANRWDDLAALGPHVGRLNDAIRAAGDANGISGSDMRQRARLTQAILEHFAEVDRHTQPWLTAVRQLIGSATLSSRVKSAYLAVR